MKRHIKNGAAKIGQYARTRPSETAWAIFGACFGFISGLLLGGVGIAALGSALGVSGSLMPILLAAIGTLIGSRYGMEWDRKRDEKSRAQKPFD